MPITSVTKDPQALTMTVVAEFPVPVERLWEAYTDPRQIEKFWGPESWPATFYRHDFYPGGRSHYAMRGPDGEASSGFWEFLAIDPGKSFEVRDGFANADGEENPEMPAMRMVFSFESTATGSRMTDTTFFPSLEALEQMVAMGMEEGMRSAMSQIDGVVADLASFAASRRAEAQILSDTQVRVSRVVRGTVDQVWQAYHDPKLVKRWMLGPDGWTMPVCELPAKVGDTYRLFWEPEGEGDGFGFDGELLEVTPPRREVTTEHMTDTDYPSTTNEMTLTPVADGTLVSVVITYPNAEVRDMVLGTGMTDGMETSYARLEAQLSGASA
ncbi:SRPBCC family protein [Demequina sp.]|uniref:SRPBCC family protein n=1 Tax=Demequina sp. TaxID=2050685 RepID=UPI0025C7382C|nr:SRPBCC family protein [Demequina sp.]